jgi:archaeal flagellar protein FlaI
VVEQGKACGYTVERSGEDSILRIDCDECNKIPSIEDSPLCMARTIDKLIHLKNVTKIIYSQKRDYEYGYNQTQLLVEIGNLFVHIVKQGILSLAYNETQSDSEVISKINELQQIMLYHLKSDPLGAYVMLRRILRREKIASKGLFNPGAHDKYMSMLTYILRALEKTRIVHIAQPYLAGYTVGDRDVYRKIFSPSIRPDFMFTKLQAAYPLDGEELDNYMAGSTEVTIFRRSSTVQYLYHIMPPEFKLNEDKYELLDLARKILSEHKPKRQEFINPERMRQIFINVASDLLTELAQQKNIPLKEKELKELTEILVRYTVGFGLVEVLLSDEKIQDISINSPMGRIPIFIVHEDFGDCNTNIIPTSQEAESWASKLRMISGRPLDEANPILDTELELPGASIRTSTITQPLDPDGLAFSFRRHRNKPWTLPLFIKYNMITPLCAGLISFIVDGTRSMLIAGTRGSGKSSLLSGILIEIMRRYRIITIEDTLELPVKAMRELGFNIQPMKVASALTGGENEFDASDGIRSTLRLGDSSLIVGEVRSTEAKALYEAMRVGAAANVVAGTIHGDSPYGIYDRVVNDIGVPKTSFKATDICIIANPVRSADGLHKYRRVTQITEVRKFWEDDPFTEGGFADLMKYEAVKDKILPTDDLLNGDSEILKLIAGNIKEFAGNWDALWTNIELRSELKEEQLKVSQKLNAPELLEAPFTIRCNDMFHLICNKVSEDVGYLEPKRIKEGWMNWIKRYIKEYKITNGNEL